MSSTFTTNKSLDLMATGDQVDQWGNVLNTDVFTIVDQCLGSSVAIALSNAPVTLTTSQIQNLSFAFSGTLTADVTVTIPAVGGIFFMRNGTTGAFNVIIASAGAGTSQILPQGYTSIFVTEGTNIFNVVPPKGPFTDIAAAATVDIGTIPNGLVNVTGSGVMITSFGTTARSVQSIFLVKFAASNTIVNSANLLCPGGANITTNPNDVFQVWYAGGGVYRVLGAMLASGQPLVSPSQTWVPKPQTVLSGPKTATGVPNFLPSTSASLNLTSQGLTTTPMVLTAAGGYGPTGLINNTLVLSSDQTWACPPNSNPYLGYNVATQATLTTLLKPIYQFGGSISTTSGQYTYDIIAGQMYVGTGSSYVTASVVFVGECVTSSTTVTKTICYAYQRQFYFANTSGSLPGTSTSVSQNCNIGTNVGIRPSVKVIIRTASGSLTAGMIVENISVVSAGPAYGTMAVFSDGYTVGFNTGNYSNGLAWTAYSAPGGSYYSLYGLNADYILQVDTDW